jgi:hypothetical protein
MGKSEQKIKILCVLLNGEINNAQIKSVYRWLYKLKNKDLENGRISEGALCDLSLIGLHIIGKIDTLAYLTIIANSFNGWFPCEHLRGQEIRDFTVFRRIQ